MSDEAGTGLDFTIQIDATQDLAADDDRVEALVTVQAHQGGARAPAARLAEVLIMDRSGSMAERNKIHEARNAACAAIDALPDGALLGIIAGSTRAECVFPPVGGLAVIDATARAAAKQAVMRLMPVGGTRIGHWLDSAGKLFAAELAAGGIRHAVLYTDGRNQHETGEELSAALDACAERFACDVRGVGEDWDYQEVRRIADALQGDAAAVLEVADLAEDFTRLIRQVMRIVVPRTYLRVADPSGRFHIAAIAQTKPTQIDLMPRQSAETTSIDVPLGSWDEQATREYQLSLRFDPAAVPIGDRVRAARVELLTEEADGRRLPRSGQPLMVIRHPTRGFATLVPESLTRVEDERELGLAMRACADAWDRWDHAEAGQELDHALRLARELGDIRLALLKAVADTGHDGAARLRADVTRGEMQRLGLESTRTGWARPRPRPRHRADAPSHSPRAEALADRVVLACMCGEREEEEAAYCGACGQPLPSWTAS